MGGVRRPLIRGRETIAVNNHIGWLDVGGREFNCREDFGAGASRKCKVHPRCTSTLRALRSKQIAMTVYKEKSISSSSAQRQGASQEDAAIAAEYNRKSSFIE